ncbi:Alpha/Beta hydrolase protein [Mrakia frigida]|uniref:Alpha/Beta hydrolase protein n=1 Tax=Mrakia frigida TaxID=29902 RepID=UPI003FCBF539
MTLTPHLGLQYPPPPSTLRHARHNVDIYLPTSSPTKGLIVFVPGGAWISSSSLDETLDQLPSLFPQDYALAIVNYRLSRQRGEEELAIKHPSHVLDVQAAVEWLVEGGAGGLLDEKTRSNVWIMGHSAGGHIIAQLLLETPSITPLPDSVRSRIKGYMFSEPIADIDSLVEEYPDYLTWFISAAFGPPPYLSASPANEKSPFTLPTIYQTNPPSVLISSSPKDELISSRQPLELKARLEGLGFKDTLRYEGDWLGKNGEEGNHDQLLKSESFGRLVKDWVKEEL